jgi:hypothetical protein
LGEILIRGVIKELDWYIFIPSTIYLFLPQYIYDLKLKECGTSGGLRHMLDYEVLYATHIVVFPSRTRALTLATDIKKRNKCDNI